LQNNTFRKQSDVNLSPLLAAKMCGEVGVKCHLFLPSELGEQGRWKAARFGVNRCILVCSIYIGVQNSMSGWNKTVSLQHSHKNCSEDHPASLQRMGAKRQRRGTDNSVPYIPRLNVCSYVMT